MTSTAYGLAWDARRHTYRSECRDYRCYRCGRKGDLDLHHPYGAGNRWPVGGEPSWALIPLCQRCHDLIHARHRNMARRRRWMIGARVVNPHDYYRTLATFTWRHVYLGRALAWRDGFPFMGRLPAWSLPPRSWR